MRGELAVLAVGAVVLFGLSVRASEKPAEGYQKAEKDLNVANNSLRNNVKSIDYAGLQKDAVALKTAFAVMLEVWQEKKVDDAVKFIQTGMTAAGDLETAAKAMNYNGVLTAQNAVAGSNGVAFVGDTGLPGVCVGCHLAHRQRMPDGSYEIKWWETRRLRERTTMRRKVAAFTASAAVVLALSVRASEKPTEAYPGGDEESGRDQPGVA